MKQLILISLLTAAAMIGSFTNGPIVGLTIYYLFAVLRPQYMWEWALPPGVSWSWYVAVATCVATVGYALGAVPLVVRPDAERVRPTVAHWLMVGFAFWVTLSYITAYDRFVAWRWLQEYLKIFLMFAIGTYVVKSRHQIWIIYLVVTGALVYIAYEINYLYVVNRYLAIWRRGYGGLDNNGAGLMLAMGLPLALYAWEGSRRWWRWGFLAGTPLMIHAVLMSYSRGAMLALLLTSPFLVWRARRRRQFAVVLLAFVLTVPAMAGREIRERFFSIEDYETEASANSRFGSWRAAIAIARDHPLLGVGIRNSNLFTYDYGADMIGRTIHSQYLQILADSGYPALTLYVGAMLMFFWSTQRARAKAKGEVDEEGIRMLAMITGLQGSLAVFVIGGVFLSLEVFELPYVVMLLGLQAAAIGSRGRTAGGQGSKVPQDWAGSRPIEGSRARVVGT